MRQFSRREFLGVAAAGSGAVLSACSLDVPGPRIWTHEEALIAARPGTPTQTPTIGYQALDISTVRDGMMYVPTTYDPATPAPLVVLLHGYASNAGFWEDGQIGELTDDLGMVIVAPDSRFSSWDSLEPAFRGYGPDAKFLNIALTYAFQRCNIDPARVAIGGFVDGAYEAIGLGLANGDLFKYVIGFSPSGLYAPFVQGQPKVYITQGDNDGPVLDYTQYQIVARIVDAGYHCEFVTFDGGLELPPAVARTAMEWMLA